MARVRHTESIELGSPPPADRERIREVIVVHEGPLHPVVTREVLSSSAAADPLPPDLAAALEQEEAIVRERARTATFEELSEAARIALGKELDPEAELAPEERAQLVEAVGSLPRRRA